MTMRIRDLFAYALPAAPLAALTLPLYIIVPTYYSETIGISLSAVGAILIAVRIIDAVMDPFLGWLSDRWRPRFGRRRAFVAVAIPIAALAAFMLFRPPTGAGAAYLFGWATLLSVGYTALLLPYSAWGAELATDYRDRSRMAGFRESSTLVGTLIAISLPFAIGLENGGLGALGVAVALGLIVFGAITVWTVPEPAEHTVAQIGIMEGLRHMAANRPFVRLIVAYLVNGLGNSIPATLFLYFVSVRLEAESARGPLLFLYFVAGLVGVPIGVKFAARMGKHRAWCVAMLVNVAIFATVPLLGAGDTTLFAIICGMTGICLGFDLALPSAIQADVIDVDTAASGEQRSGIYFAAWSLATKLSLALSVAIVFPLLALFGFDPGAGAQNTPEAVTALVGIYVWIPIVLKLIAVGLMWNFPLGEIEQAKLREKIESRRASSL